MRTYRRIGVAAAIGVTALGLAACGSAEIPGSDRRAGQTAVEVPADLSAEGQALAALGFRTRDIEPAGYPAAEPSPDAQPSTDAEASPAAKPRPSAGAGERAKPGWRKRHLNRVLLRRNTLHGEVVVQTKDGTKTLLVQRGQVTAIDDTTVTVKSADGFTQKWQFGERLRVVERRTTIQPKDIAVGTTVGVAGVKEGDRSVARLVVIPAK